MRKSLLLCLLLTAGFCLSASAGDATVRIARFHVDATPPIGSPVAYAPARTIEDPLSARGIVLLSDQQAIVLCAVDWIGIGNGGHDAWRERLAHAAGTTADRVAVHTLHQHDAPRCDFTSEALLAERGLGGQKYDNAFARATLEKAVEAVRASISAAQPVTHIGVGTAKVEKVASNRRILGPDGKVRIVRYSKATNPEAIAAPEGVIDPYCRLISFWNADEPLVSITYYATHPQSYYGQGDVTAEFVGMARAMREKAVPAAAHIHFNGAGGNVAAGKYNDGSPEMRPILAQRLATGMEKAWEAAVKQPLTTADLEWRVRPVQLPPAEHLVLDELRTTLNDPQSTAAARLGAATDIAWLERCHAGHEIPLACLRLGNVYILHMPGELFVEYQLAAQKLRPDATVCMAAYGDYGPGYIGTEIAYSQGGYETSPRATNVAPGVERVLMDGIKDLLK